MRREERVAGEGGGRGVMRGEGGRGEGIEDRVEGYYSEGMQSSIVLKPPTRTHARARANVNLHTHSHTQT